MTCDKCKRKVKTVYYNRKNKDWECEKCTEYLKKQKDEKLRF